MVPGGFEVMSSVTPVHLSALGVSHSLINARFGSKHVLWYATVDWTFEPLTRKLAGAFAPTLTDPLGARLTRRARAQGDHRARWTRSHEACDDGSRNRRPA